MFLLAGAMMLSRVMQADDDLPKPLSFARYEPILNHSPFAVATAAAVAPMTADFAKDLYIANAAHSPDGDWVALASSTGCQLPEIPNHQPRHGRLHTFQHRMVGPGW